MPNCYLFVGWLGEKGVSVKNRDAVLGFVRDIFCEREECRCCCGRSQRDLTWKANGIHITHFKNSWTQVELGAETGSWDERASGYASVLV